MENKTGLKPLGRAVLVLPEEAREVKRAEGSRIVLPETAKERMMLQEVRARVIEIGPQAWKDELEPRCKVGDLVMVSRFAGTIVESPVDGKQYRCVNGNDIFLRIEESQSH